VIWLCTEPEAGRFCPMVEVAHGRTGPELRGGDRHRPHRGERQQEGPMAESYTGEAYCVKCKAKREFTGHVEETNGRRFAKGICPECGTKVTRILGKA